MRGERIAQRPEVREERGQSPERERRAVSRKSWPRTLCKQIKCKWNRPWPATLVDSGDFLVTMTMVLLGSNPRNNRNHKKLNSAL